MAKLNKYWGFVALGAVTAAAAGAIAAFMTKKNSPKEILDYEEDFDEDLDGLSVEEDEEEAEKSTEDFVAWDENEEAEEAAAPKEETEEPKQEENISENEVSEEEPPTAETEKEE